MSHMTVTLCSALVLALPPAMAMAGVVAPTRPSQIVTVHHTGSTSGCGGNILLSYFDQEVRSDGTTGPIAPFTAPAGEVLIVTDVSVVLAGTANTGAGAYLSIGDATSAVPVTADFTTATSPDGLARLHIEFPNGLVVRSGKSLCVQSYNSLIDTNSSFNGFHTKDR